MINACECLYAWQGVIAGAQANGGGPDPSDFLAGVKVLDGEIARAWEAQSDSESVTKLNSKASSVEEGRLSGRVQSRPVVPKTEVEESEWELPPHYNRAGSFFRSEDRHLAFRRSIMTYSDKVRRGEARYLLRFGIWILRLWQQYCLRSTVTIASRTGV